MAPQKYKLMYFDFRALAEPIRFLFHYGKVEFEDYRYTQEEWVNEIKPTARFGQGPLLEIDGDASNRVVQSVAIQRYVAKLVGLAGQTPLEQLEVDIMAETIWDFRCLLYQWYFDKTPNKELRKDQVLKVEVPFMLDRFNKTIQTNGGYFVNGKLTWPDLQYTAYYEYFCRMAGFDLDSEYPALRELRKKVLEVPQIKRWTEIRPQSDF